MRVANILAMHTENEICTKCPSYYFEYKTSHNYSQMNKTCKYGTLYKCSETAF